MIEPRKNSVNITSRSNKEHSDSVINILQLKPIQQSTKFTQRHIYLMDLEGNNKYHAKT